MCASRSHSLGAHWWHISFHPHLLLLVVNRLCRRCICAREREGTEGEKFGGQPRPSR